MSQTPRHRHFVVLPLLGFAVALPLIVNATGLLQGIAVEFESLSQVQQDTFSHPSGLRGIIQPGGQVNFLRRTPRLTKGSALLAGEGLFEVMVDRYRLIGLDGAFHVVKQGNNVTVSAVTTPVLVMDGNARQVIPARYHWKSEDLESFDQDELGEWVASRSIRALPDRFLKTQLEAVRKIPETHKDVLPGARPHPSPKPKIVAGFLPGAQKRHMEAWGDSVLGAVRGRIENGNSTGVADVLRDSDHYEMLTSPEGVRVLSIILSRLPEKTPYDTWILGHLVKDERFWLVASVHDEYHGLLWTMRPPRDRVENRIVRLWSFPQADVLPVAFNSIAFERWQGDFAAFVKTLQEPSALYEELLTALAPLAEQLYAYGYPERADRLAQVLFDLRETYALSNEALKSLDALSRLGDVEIHTAPVPERAKEVVEEPEMTPQEIENAAYEALRDVGAVFTINTEIVATKGSKAEVKAIVFGTAKGDRMFDFVYDVPTGRISQVQEGERKFPFGMTLLRFVSWLRS